MVRADRHHGAWEMAFIDDGSKVKGEPVARRVLGGLAGKVAFHDTGMSPQMKKECGGTFIGRYMNGAVRRSDADLVVMVGDDDELCEHYLSDLDDFFSARPEVPSCYSDTVVFDPTAERSEAGRTCSSDPGWKGHEWFGKPINCSYKVDGVQVAVRAECFKVHGAWFPYPTEINHDALFLQELHDRCGPSVFGGFVGTCKGRHAGQLVNRLGGGGTMTTGANDKKRSALMA